MARVQASRVEPRLGSQPSERKQGLKVELRPAQNTLTAPSIARAGTLQGRGLNEPQSALDILNGRSSFDAGAARSNVAGQRSSAAAAPTRSYAAGDVETDSYVEGPSFDVNLDANAELTQEGLEVGVTVEVDATAAEAGASANQTYEFEVGGETYTVEVDLSAMIEAGVHGEINISLVVGTDGTVSINASAEGFAGVQASISGSIELKHEGDVLAEGSITASATAGVAGSANFDIGTGENGSIEFEAGVEVVAGVGVGVEVEGSINPGNILEALVETAAGLGVEFVGDVAESVIEAAEDLGEVIGDVAENVGDFLEDIYPF
ncbi:Circumsporozoite protein [Archangium minus]|uniref:Circumsporozoite protein n=1 Tax=Archangium minus TaxID=83450 RepID=A0ABY9WLL8_9BACT|nr:Circumsporozoite protein [Archangium minus]